MPGFRSTLGIGLLALVLVVGAINDDASVPRYADGPPLEVTGGFGEATCFQCHADGPRDSMNGVIIVNGLPDSFVAGRLYNLDLLVSHPAIQVAGFQIAARYLEGHRTGARAGAFETRDEDVGVAREPDTGVEYAFHTRVRPAIQDTSRWSFLWRAPEGREEASVIFHVAANAANNDDSEFGDVILIDSVVTLPLEMD